MIIQPLSIDYSINLSGIKHFSSNSDHDISNEHSYSPLNQSLIIIVVKKMMTLL